jgi:hypothetical protein
LRGIVNAGAYKMDYKTATDALFNRVSHEDLAEELGVSVAAIRQARLDVSAKAHRPPPRGWELAVIGLAENRIRRYHELIGQLEVRLPDASADAVPIAAE